MIEAGYGDAEVITLEGDYERHRSCAIGSVISPKDKGPGPGFTCRLTVGEEYYG
jgi:hypothetical protein